MQMGIVRDWRYPPILDFDSKDVAAVFDRAAAGTKFITSIDSNWQMQLTKKP